MRKDSNFKVSDRINLYIKSEKKIIEAAFDNQNYIKNEVLALKVFFNEGTGQYSSKFSINDLKVEISISLT